MSTSLTSYPCCKNWDEWHRCFSDASPTLNTLRRAFTCLVRWAFSSPQSFGGYEDILGCMQYSQERKDSKITIQPGSVLDPGDTENIPGILIQCGDGIHYQTVGARPDTNYSADTSSYNSACLAKVNMTFLCRHNDADICCAMGDLVTLFIFALYPRLMDDTWSWMRQIELVSQSEPAMQTHPSDSTRKWYESSVVISIVYEYNVFGARESKRLKAYSVYAEPKAADLNLDTK